ncbi:type II toxin-antitoxin system VapC family toxin [Candidatus Gottesmanbacteria bacterium]|nr:type II toxin-antitoxin system VapC family toxin [Candidatus Gottesmanbacteria bacterium]
MTVLLDTNILIDFFHDVPRSVAVVKTLRGGHFGVSVLTVMEITHEAHKTKMPERYINEFKNFLADFSVDVWPIDEAVAARCGELLAVMEQRGVRLGVIDALLAATALVNKYSVVSGDAAFRKIPGLDVYPAA